MRLRLASLMLVIGLTAGAAHAAEDAELIARGRTAYESHCLRCHGEQGKGDGWEASRLYVPARDLTSGLFKFKTTWFGTPPSDADLLNGILNHGVTGSGMPSFGTLSSDVKESLVAYIKSISPAYQGDKKPDPVPAPNTNGGVDLKQGAELYTNLQCASCHGAHGRGNGNSAATMKDVWGHPLRPSNLTQGWTYGGGNLPADIYYRLLAGIDPSGMPSYVDALKSPQFCGDRWKECAWNLAQYVRSLQTPMNFTLEIDAAHARALPTTGADAAWDAAPLTVVNMDAYLLVAGKRVPFSINAVTVKALYSEDGVAFRLYWDDPTKDDGKSPDKLMLAFRPENYSGDPRGNLHNLYESPNALLDVLLWDASEPTAVRSGTTSLPALLRNGLSGHSLTSESSYDDGRWTLVVVRKFDSETGFRNNGKPLMLSFAGWDGGHGETNDRHSASQWIWLNFGKRAGRH